MWAGSWEVRRFAEIDSTNTYLKAQASSGAPEGVVAVADHQTAGRGRLDRSWEAPPGASLLMSVLFRPALSAVELHLCTAAVALAAVQACEEAAAVPIGIKWPNDLMVGPRKLAGVLAEAEFSGNAVDWVVIGIGINVAWPGPPGVGGTCLDELGTPEAPIAPADLLEALLGALAPRRDQLDSGDGRRRLTAELRARCTTLGQQVRVELGGEVVSGWASDIDDAGHLVVTTATGARTVNAGDVVHLRPD